MKRKILATMVGVLVVCSGRPALADAPVPADKLSEYVGQECLVEFRVAAVKHSERRHKHFLNSSPNFRSQENLGVAIDDTRLAQFDGATTTSLTRKYLNHTLRARGQLIREENQLLVVVTAPEQLEIVAPVAPPAGASTLVVVNETGVERTIDPAEAAFPRVTVQVEHHGMRESYEGVPLSALLEKAEVLLGPQARGALLARYVLVDAVDNYRALLAVAEVDPHLSAQQILLADRKDGQPLSTTDRPWRLVVPADKHRRRWVRQVHRIAVHEAAVAAEKE